MPQDSTFKRLELRPRETVELWLDGEPVQARVGDSAAAVVLAQGMTPSRSTTVSGAPRAPYCMMGVCFECLLEIDGVANRQGCMTPVRDGMRINRQQGVRSSGAVPGITTTGPVVETIEPKTLSSNLNEDSPAEKAS